MRRCVLSLAALVGCRSPAGAPGEHPTGCDFAASSQRDAPGSLELIADRTEVGFGKPVQVQARVGGHEPSEATGLVTWTQLEGPALQRVETGPGGRRFSAQMPPIVDVIPGPLPWGVVPISPRTRAEIVIQAEWHRPSASPMRQSIRIAAASRSRGLPNVPVGPTLYLGGEGWHVATRPPDASADVGASGTFAPDREGVFTLIDHAGRMLRVQAGRYDATPLDCGRTGCHREIAASIERSPMTRSLARLLDRPAIAEDASCALACHATGEPGTHDGGFCDVGQDLGLGDGLDGARDLASLPRPLRRLGGVGCLACHGPSALPEADARWSILRSDVCAYCHDAPPRYGHVAGWRAAAMSRADRSPRARADAACVGCHTTWGFLDRELGATPDRAGARRPPEDVGSVGIACPACHDVHRGDREGSPLLRTALLADIFSDVPAEARIRSGICMTCHAPDASAGLAHASAAAIWAGRGGVGPETGAPLAGAAPHALVPGGCVGCHSCGPSELRAGANHAFRASAERCATCHGDRVPTAGPSLDAEAHLLWKRLVDSHLVEGSSLTSDEPEHASARVRPRIAKPLARAALDISLVLEDPAAAIHNPTYARMLLDTARKALDRRP